MAGGMQLPLENSGADAERKAHREVEEGNEAVDQERLIGRVRDHRTGLGQLDEPDH